MVDTWWGPDSPEYLAAQHALFIWVALKGCFVADVLLISIRMLVGVFAEALWRFRGVKACVCVSMQGMRESNYHSLY